MVDATLVATLACFAFIFLIFIICGVWYMCCKKQPPEGDVPGYAVATSNRLFKGSFLRSNKELPCLNCQFIEMGEMACYQETCPDCGRVPPVRQKEIRKYKECLEVAQREDQLPPEDDMSTVPQPASPRKTLNEKFMEAGL